MAACRKLINDILSAKILKSIMASAAVGSWLSEAEGSHCWLAKLGENSAGVCNGENININGL